MYHKDINFKEIHILKFLNQVVSLSLLLTRKNTYYNTIFYKKNYTHKNLSLYKNSNILTNTYIYDNI